MKKCSFMPVLRWGTHLYMSLFPSVHPSVCRTPCLRNRTPSNHNFWYTCKMMISPGTFFIFLKFWFFGLLGVKGQKITQNEKNNYMCHVPYLRNSRAYDHDLWDTCVNDDISRCFFFLIFIFRAVTGVKGQKITQIQK